MPDIPETNLALWLKADAIVGLNDDDLVSQWDDASGNSHHATQAVSDSKPTYKTNILNGKAVVRFNGDFLSGSGVLSGSSAFTVFLVFARRGNYSNHRAPFSLGNDNAHAGFCPAFSLVGSTSYNSWWAGNNGQVSVGTIAQDSFHYISVVYDGSTNTTYLDGVALTPTNYSSSNLADSYQVGRGTDSNYYEICDIAEIITYSSAKSSSDISDIHAYISDKYFPVPIEADITDAAEIADSIDGDSPYRDITEALSIADSIDGMNLTDGIAEGVTLDDQTDAFSLTDIVADSLLVTDDADILVEYSPMQADALSIGDALSANGSQYSTINSDAATIADTFSVFDWTAFLIQCEDQVITRYYFTLTGDADGETDAVIPISSFSIRRRNGEGSYLSVVIPTLDYSTDVTDRSNGDMKLEVAYLVANVEVLRETLIVVDLESVRTDEGSNSQSITLSGHRDESFGGQICTPRGVSYKSCTDGKWLVRCLPDPYLRPGDTIRVNNVDLFEADMVSMYASESYHSMEVSES